MGWTQRLEQTGTRVSRIGLFCVLKIQARRENAAWYRVVTPRIRS
jgi:hypothetical protein